MVTKGYDEKVLNELMTDLGFGEFCPFEIDCFREGSSDGGERRFYTLRCQREYRFWFVFKRKFRVEKVPVSEPSLVALLSALSRVTGRPFIFVL